MKSSDASKFVFSYVCPIELRSEQISSLFRSLHRAKLLGLEFDRVFFNGRFLTEDETERLRLFVHADGAWRCSAMPWPDAHRVFERVISGGLGRVPVGRMSGGRWASWSALEVFLRDGREGVQSEFGF